MGYPSRGYATRGRLPASLPRSLPFPRINPPGPLISFLTPPGLVWRLCLPVHQVLEQWLHYLTGEEQGQGAVAAAGQPAVVPSQAP